MHGVATMCRVLGVSTSGYYAWRTRAVRTLAHPFRHFRRLKRFDSGWRPQLLPFVSETAAIGFELSQHFIFSKLRPAVVFQLLLQGHDLSRASGSAAQKVCHLIGMIDRGSWATDRAGRHYTSPASRCTTPSSKASIASFAMGV
jgi:hypothetical protein